VRPFVAGNRAGRGRRPALVSLGVRVEDAKDPEYLLELRRGARYRKRRVSELCSITGGELSAGASLMVKHEAMAAVGAAYLFAQAAREGLSVERRAELLLQMDRLSHGAKQHALAAWELALREGTERKARRERRPVLARSDDEALADRKRREEQAIEAEGEEVPE
jgi:hypothetical protein